ncbi:hypothetical protein BVI2075_160051 [Burkholderia vietnamiensis]|nr:hypothetical protein BVI2075_160051 [Burkholderia vietnamiensis]
MPPPERYAPTRLANHARSIVTFPKRTAVASRFCFSYLLSFSSDIHPAITLVLIIKES